ncbi:MAG: EAL domain-containing protein [Chloroflexota bacterium]
MTTRSPRILRRARTPGTHRTTPSWAVVLLMAVVALAVVASVPVSHALRAAHERATLVYRLADLVNRERDASWNALALGYGAPPSAIRSATEGTTQHEELVKVLGDLAPVLPDGLAEQVQAFEDLVDQQLQLVAEARPIAARELERLQVRAAYQELIKQIDAAAVKAADQSKVADAWETAVLMVIAIVAMAVVLVLFAVLQRRNAAYEFGAGRRFALEEEGRRLRALISASSDLIVVIDDAGKVTWASPSVAAMMGRAEQDVIGTTPSSLMHPDDLPLMAAGLARLRAGTDVGPQRFECRVRLGADGTDERWMEIIVADGRNEPGIGGLILTGHDVTERRRATDERAARERELRELVEHVNGVFYRCELGAAGRWTFVSPQIVNLLGWSAEEWMTDPGLWGRSIHPDDRERVMREEQEPTRGAIDYRMFTRAGELRWIRDDAAPMDPDGTGAPYWAGTLTDVTRAYLVEEELRYQAHHDALTGLPNRSLLLDRLGNALDRSRRKPLDVGVVYIDLDDFKNVNDELGHAAGDDLLVAIAERLRAAIRPGDTAARLGGDEFALIVEEVDRETLAAIADRALASLDAPIVVAGREVAISASLGVAVSRGSGTDPERMLRDADTAMYVAKRQGKQRWVFFDPTMSGPQRQRVRMESDLRRALASEEFDLVYQPVVRLSDGRMEGAEALLRWHSPDSGTVDPSEFMEVAEESGLMVHIGRWVLRRACHDAAMWQRYTRRGVWLGVNISARQLLDPGMVPSVVEALKDSELPADHLVLEVTESAALRDLDAVEARLAELRATGVRLAIDDFGTGTSSIGHLRRLDFDIIKIDGSLVADIRRNPDAQDLVRSIVHISRTLRAQPLAEGVEEADQVAALRAAGCELGQGYLFARPMDALLLRDTFLPRNLGASAV